MDPTYSRIRLLIEQGETKSAIQETKIWIRSADHIPIKTKNRFLDECVLLSSRLSDWEGLVFKGLIHYSDRSCRNMINFALLLLLSEVHDLFFQKSPPLENRDHVKKRKHFQEEVPDREDKKVLIQITLNKDFDQFDTEEKKKFVEALENLPFLEKEDIVIKKIFKGSVNIVVELPYDKVKSLILSSLNHELDDINLTEVCRYLEDEEGKKIIHEGYIENNSNRLHPASVNIPKQDIADDNVPYVSALEEKEGLEEDQKSLDEIYTRNYSKLLLIAIGYVRNRETAEDIVQDVFLKLMHKEQALSEINNIESYLISCVINKSKDIYKRVQRQQKLEAEIAQYIPKKTVEDLLDFEAKPLFDYIKGILSEEELLVLEMSKTGYKAKEIANAIGKSEGHVRVIKHKAIKILRENTLIQDFLESVML